MDQQTYKRWDSNSSHGKLLLSLIVNKQIPDRMPTHTIQELYPQFRVYRTENFSTVVSRFRKKLANGDMLNTTPAPIASAMEVTPAEYASNFHAHPSKYWLIVVY